MRGRATSTTVNALPATEAIMKLVYWTAFTLATLLALLTLVGTIYTATSGHYNATPTIIGAGVTLMLGFMAWTALHEVRRL